MSASLMSEKSSYIYTSEHGACCVSITLTHCSKGCWFEADRLRSDIVKSSTSDRNIAGTRLTGGK